jgi:hypothetical protein
MAFDVTSLQTAIAEGKVDETEALQLLNQFYNWELAVAKLLTPKTEPEAASEVPAEASETLPTTETTEAPPEPPTE